MKRKRGLTLVELIVVIGLILFIVTVFIFPTFERTRDKATEVVCISNLRQIGQALLMYAQDYEGLVPPYCNLDERLLRLRDEKPPFIAFSKAQRWRKAFEPYVHDNGIFFCPNDPFAGLPPEKTPCQGAPVRDNFDCNYARDIDHSITSYCSCIGFVVGEEVLEIEDLFAKGYYITIDPYYNIENFPPQWHSGLDWSQIATQLHEVTVYLEDRIHYYPEGLRTRQSIELFVDGHVEIHPCSIWKELKESLKRKAKEGERK